MNLSKRVLLPSVLGLLLVFSLTTSAQWEKKPYTEWTEKDAQKVLNDSPWGRTQVFSTPSVAYQGPITGRGGIGATRSGNPPDRPTDAIHVKFRVRFFSAKPIRQAFSRQRELKEKKPISEELAAQLKQYASGEVQEVIVIAVTCDSDDPGNNVQQANSLLRTNSTASLKNNTFIEIKGGKRVFLQEFRPARDDVGARFIFPRLIDGQPFVTLESEEIHFVTQLSDNYKLDRRYKTKEMMYEGKLEY